MPLTINVARIYLPTADIIKEINNILFKYLWQNYPYEQLARKKLTAETQEAMILKANLIHALLKKLNI